MTTTTGTATVPPAPSAPGAGPPADDKAAATVMIAGFLLHGPVGLVVMALAVGIERAFLRSGWERPAVFGGGTATPTVKLTPEELAAKRAEAVRLAREFIDGYRAREAARRIAHEAHRQAHRDWTNNGRQGDEPIWDGSRGTGEFIADLYRASKSWGTLFNDRLGREFDKFNDAGETFFKNLWAFLAGFVEGVREVFDEARERKRLEQEQADNDRTWNLNPDSHDADDPGQYRPDPPAIDAASGTPDSAGGPDLDPTTPNPGQPEAADPTRPPIVVPSTTGTDPTRPNRPLEGEVMTADNQPVLTGSDSPAVPASGPLGTANLELLLLQAFQPAQPLLAVIPGQIKELAAEHATAGQRLAYIQQLCMIHRAPTAVIQMVAAGRATINELGRGMALVEQHTEIARELTDEALIGLQPSQRDLADIRSEGATGDLLGAADSEGN